MKNRSQIGVKKVLVAGVAAVMVMLSGSLVSAGEFSTESDEWHGLSSFVSLADGQGIDYRDVGRLDWADVASDDVIVVIYPERELDVTSLASFVVDGGRVLVADDFGMSGSFLERLDVERSMPEAEDLPHRSFVDDHPGWPRFSIEGRHPLLEGVEEVVANYPAVFDNVGGAVVAYDEEGGLIYDMKLGEGRAVVIADPGVLINSMLAAGDNDRLAANIWSYLCSDVDDCRAWVMSEDVEFSGAFDADRPDREQTPVAERIDEFNERLQDVFSRLPGTDLLYVVTLLLVIGSAAYLVTVFPWRRARRLSRYIGRRRRELSEPRTEFDWNIERFTDPDGRINYALPAAILKESFEELFLAGFDLWPSPPDQRPSVGMLAKRFEERYLRGEPAEKRRSRRRELERLLGELTKIPRRDHVFLEGDDHVSGRELEKLHERMRRVLGWMGLEEEYERRTRNIDIRKFRARR